jgi:DAK2 domain fusion protein YloV
MEVSVKLINGQILRDAVISGANNINAQKQAVDELNIFPVPDGDTGTNMSMTINAAARELATKDSNSVGEIASITAGALLRGARGNSGVILSLFFRGFSKGLKGLDEADGQAIVESLTKGVQSAYKAVMNPTEGTILTVGRVAAEKATEFVKTNNDPVVVFEKIVEYANEALLTTPDLLPVLKKAGVVDSGGKGLCVIFEGMLSVIKDGVIISGESSEDVKPKKAEKKNAAAEFEGEITFTYCTEFIVKKANDKDPLTLRAYLETIGDSVVVVDDENIIKVHVHTDHPGKAFEKGITFGQLINMKVENMREQHENAGNDEEVEVEENTEVAPKTNPYGFVAVAAGEGVANLFTDLGVDKVVSGGQTMNPSTDDILKAIEATPAEVVFVLPNNKNIIMAAEQAKPLATREVHVIQTKTIPMGISAMLAFDPESDSEANLMAMIKATENVGTGQVTFAARDSDFEGKKIKAGELLALENGKISFVDTDITKTVLKLCKSLYKKDSNFITLIYGEGINEEDAESLAGVITQKIPGAEVSVINGGQPVYYYIISVE